MPTETGGEIPKEAREFKTPEKLIEEGKPIIKEVLDKWQEIPGDVEENDRVEFQDKTWVISQYPKKTGALCFFRELEPSIKEEYHFVAKEGRTLSFKHSKLKSEAEKTKVLSRSEIGYYPGTKDIETTNGEEALAKLQEIQKAIREGNFKFTREKK